MRICFVSREIGGITTGGIGTYVAEAGKALTAHGHEVWLVTQPPDQEKRPALDRLPGFHRVLVVGEDIDTSVADGLFHGVPSYPYSFKVHQTLQGCGVHFDYIEFPDYAAEGLIPVREDRLFGTYSQAGTVLAVKLHSPSYECFRDDEILHLAGQVVRETCLLEDYTIRTAPFLSSPTRRFSSRVAARLGLDIDTVDIVPYPMVLPPELPAPPKPRERLEDLSFFYFGRIEKRKGVHHLVEAFRRMPELELRLLGGDVWCSPYGKSLRDYLRRRAPENVVFLDEVPRTEAVAMLETADVCIFPSILENYPNVCMEAMAAGRVVLGSEHGGMADMIEHGKSGFLLDGTDPDAIVRCVKEELGAALPRLDEIGRAAAVRMRELAEPAKYVERIERVVAARRARIAPLPSFDPESRKVAVVVPFYKDRETIDEAVRSAVAQTHRNLEILIVNDGSPLGDADEILARVASCDPRIRVLKKPNGGLSSARNFGVRHTDADFVLFLDADNILEPDYARAGVVAMGNQPALDFVVVNARVFDDVTKEVQGYWNPVPCDRTIALLMNRFGDAGQMFRRSVFTERGMSYDEELIAYEDWALWMDLRDAGIEGDNIPRHLYSYRVRADSMMSADAKPNHPALVALLADRHMPASNPAEKEVLATLIQDWVWRAFECDRLYREMDARKRAAESGGAADRDSFEAAEPPPEPPPELTLRPRPPLPTRYVLADKLAGAARRVPGLSNLLRIVAQRLIDIANRRRAARGGD